MAMSENQSVLFTENETINQTALESTSITTTEIWIQLVIFSFFFPFLATIANTAITLVIFRSKKFRTRVFVFVGALTFSRIVMGFQQFVVFLYRSLVTSGKIGAELEAGTCYLIHMHLIYVPTLETVLLLALVLDRMMAIMAHAYHKYLTRGQAVILSVALFIVTSALKVVPSLFGQDFHEIIQCQTVTNALNPVYVMYSTITDLALAIFCTTLYLILVIYQKFYKTPAMVTSGDQAALATFQKQLETLPLVQGLVLIHCILTVIEKSIVLITRNFPESHSERYVMYGSCLVPIDLLASAVMLMASKKELTRKHSHVCPQI